MAELFLRERPGAGEPAVLEARLQEIVDKADRVWPELAVDPAPPRRSSWPASSATTSGRG